MDLIALKYKENIPVLFLNVLLHLHPFKIIANMEKNSMIPVLSMVDSDLL